MRYRKADDGKQTVEIPRGKKLNTTEKRELGVQPDVLLDDAVPTISLTKFSRGYGRTLSLYRAHCPTASLSILHTAGTPRGTCLNFCCYIDYEVRKGPVPETRIYIDILRA